MSWRCSNVLQTQSHNHTGRNAEPARQGTRPAITQINFYSPISRSKGSKVKKTLRYPNHCSYLSVKKCQQTRRYFLQSFDRLPIAFETINASISCFKRAFLTSTLQRKEVWMKEKAVLPCSTRNALDELLKNKITSLLNLQTYATLKAVGERAPWGQRRNSKGWHFSPLDIRNVRPPQVPLPALSTPSLRKTTHRTPQDVIYKTDKRLLPRPAPEKACRRRGLRSPRSQWHSISELKITIKQSQVWFSQHLFPVQTALLFCFPAWF